jgi:aspartyl-tRNA(Asn)/glutamyl-tRNA(Gln) amidotransferase subunit B
MRKIHELVRYLEISDGNMQEGSFRCDANVSIRPRGESRLGTRTELKNLNSFRFVEKAIDVEAARQIDVLEDGGSISQETRLFDPDRNETRPMRTKEEANDYRYFPDPDLLPVLIDPALIEEVRAGLPELPDAKRARFAKQYALSEYDAGVLTSSAGLARYYEDAVSSAASASPKLIANWVQGPVIALLKEADLEIGDSKIGARELAALTDKIADGTLSGKLAAEVFHGVAAGEGTVEEIVERRGLRQITDGSAIDQLVAEVVAAHPEQAQQFRDGNEKVIGYLVGKVMKASQGKANPQQVNTALLRRLRG